MPWGCRPRASAWSSRCGAKARASPGLADHGLANLTSVPSWPAALRQPAHQVALAVLGLESGFETADAALISEEDVLGDRLGGGRRGGRPAGELHAEDA